MEWNILSDNGYKEYQATRADGLKLVIGDRGKSYGQRRFACTVRGPNGSTYRFVDLIDNIEEAKAWTIKAADSIAAEIAERRLCDAAPELLAACEAFVTAWEKSLQLEKTDVALRMARTAIAKARGE